MRAEYSLASVNHSDKSQSPVSMSSGMQKRADSAALFMRQKDLTLVAKVLSEELFKPSEELTWRAIGFVTTSQRFPCT